MELYNSEFVYFEWDDKLKGKKGFFSNSISELKQHVEDNNTMCYGKVCKDTTVNTDFPFESTDNKGYTHLVKFFYYDPYYEFRKAYLEGKQLQFKNGYGDWKDVEGEPIFNGDEYRIKPSEEYVPFDTVQELIDAWESRHPKGTIDSMPLIWIKEKDFNVRTLITEYYFERDCHEADVGTSRDYISLKGLFYDYTFLDGDVIGKVAK